MAQPLQSLLDMPTTKKMEIQQVSPPGPRSALSPTNGGLGTPSATPTAASCCPPIPGAAITEVMIDNVQHEYETLEGVREDVINILLNLKGLAVIMHDVEEASITLSRTGKEMRRSSAHRISPSPKMWRSSIRTM